MIARDRPTPVGSGSGLRGERAAARRIAVVAGLAFLAVGVLAAFVDLPLSRAVVRPESCWATFLADYGEVPGFVLAIASVALVIHLRLFRGRDAGDRAGGARGVGRSGLLRSVGSVTWTAALVLLLVYGVGRSVVFFAGGLGVAALLAVGATGGAALVALWGVASRALRTQLAEPARAVTLLAVIHPILIVQLLKALWGRVRFRHLATDFSDFTAWFAPQGVTGNESFPSGHAAMGWMLLPVAFWVAWRLRGRPATRRIVWAVTVAFGVAVAASRVVVGAHYLSDVAFSTAVAWALAPWLVAAGARDPMAR